MLILLHSLFSSSFSFAFLWIPRVDLAAKQSLFFTTITDSSLSPAYGLETYHHSLINSSWHNIWYTQPLTKLRSVKKTPTPWSSSNRLSWSGEIIVSRLRIDLTRVTHSYLLLGLYSPPSCQYCHAEEITVPHFFSCPSLQNLRESFSVLKKGRAQIRNKVLLSY